MSEISTDARGYRPVAAVGIGWIVVVALAAAGGLFHSPGAQPPLAMAISILLPVVLTAAAAWSSERFRSWARSLDPRGLVLLHTSRIGGLAFLALAAVGELPDGFAVPAGAGDILIGLTAPLIALFALGRSGSRRGWFLGWTAVGVLDLINAVALGLLYSDSVAGVLATTVSTELMESLPMIMIPAFGVPAMLVLHLLSVINVIGNLATPTRHSLSSFRGVSAGT